eukprot:364822-Chlamydomonas_euryale.AAC.4
MTACQQLYSQARHVLMCESSPMHTAYSQREARVDACEQLPVAVGCVARLWDGAGGISSAARGDGRSLASTLPAHGSGRMCGTEDVWRGSEHTQMRIEVGHGGCLFGQVRAWRCAWEGAVQSRRIELEAGPKAHGEARQEHANGRAGACQGESKCMPRGGLVHAKGKVGACQGEGWCMPRGK